MFELVNKNGVFLLKSTVLKSNHAFSTRIGGVSELEQTKGLNLAFGRGDDDSVVFENLSVFAKAVGIDDKKVISVPQIHSNIVKNVNGADAGAGYYKKHEFSCDGYVTTEDNLPLGVKTADCVPILLEARDDNGNIIAVSAVHAGWRGTADRIAEEGVLKLCSLGAKVENIYVAIGPCIDECCYEVGNDFAEQIKTKLGQNYKNKFIVEKENGSLYANLKGMNVEILTSVGVPKENIDIAPYCTCCDPELFYSHRRQKGIRGAHLHVIIK
jgi:YfiH family protein